jgi:hypothetical protein
MAVSFIGEGNQSTRKKTTDLPHVTDCTGKSNYHTIMTTPQWP